MLSTRLGPEENCFRISGDWIWLLVTEQWEGLNTQWTVDGVEQAKQSQAGLVCYVLVTVATLHYTPGAANQLKHQ